MRYTKEFCADVVAKALKDGATDAMCTIEESKKYFAEAYGRAPQGVTVNSKTSLHLALYVGQQHVELSSTDLTPQGIETTIGQALSAAKDAEADPVAGLPELALYDTKTKPAFTRDAKPLTTAQMIERASALEDASLRVAGVTSSFTNSAGNSYSRIVKANSKGWAGEYEKDTSFYVVDLVAEKGEVKANQEESRSVLHAADLPDLEKFAHETARKAVKRLNVGKLPRNDRMPVVFDPRMTSHLMLGNLTSSLNGLDMHEGKSWLKKEHLGQTIGNSALTITDHRNLAHGIGSRLFDGMGVAGPEELKLMDKGVLQHAMLGLRAARKMGLTANGRASSSNLWLAAGTHTLAALIADIEDGIYVTSSMGRGYNGLTGDMSYAVSGYLIRKGEITDTFVLAASIAGNLKDMLLHATPANDLEMLRATNAPSLRVEGMTVSGA